MKRAFVTVLAGLLMLIPFGKVSAETGIELGISGGYSDNLFFDSARVDDSYTAPYLTLSLYPSSSLELAASASYTAYHRTRDLGSVLLGTAITYIMSSDESRFSFMFSGELSTRNYGYLYREYNHYHGGALLSLRYRLLENVFLKGGAAGTANEYVNANTGNSRGYGIFGGMTATVFGANSIDIESGFDMTDFPDLYGADMQRQTMGGTIPDIEDRLKTFYYSILLSRPLASHTGLSLKYAARHFIGDEEVVIYDFSLDNLSPWTAFWEGQAASATIKSFVIPNVILSAGVEYRDVAFMDALESDIQYVGGYRIRSRDDERTAISIDITRPFVLNSGGVIRPSLSAGYIINNSTHPLYDYDSFTVSLTLATEF